MTIAIVGTGSIALATAALLARNGHASNLLSVTGEGAKGLSEGKVSSSGALEHSFDVHVTNDAAEALRDAECIIIATSANRYQDAIGLILDYIKDHHKILVSGELSQISAVLAAKLAEKGITPAITALSTTLATGRRGTDASVKIGVIRKSALACTLPAEQSKDAEAYWNSLFDDVLVSVKNHLQLTLSNINPIVHIPNALCNFTRIEKGEEWSNYGGITESVGNLIVAIDAERVALAKSCGIDVKSFKNGYESNFGFPVEMSLGQMTAELHKLRNGLPKGPTEIETRYVTEDVPFGLVVFEHLGVQCGCPTPVISASITLNSALYGRDFRLENPFMKAIRV